jgi:hypothetical protein
VKIKWPAAGQQRKEAIKRTFHYWTDNLRGELSSLVTPLLAINVLGFPKQNNFTARRAQGTVFNYDFMLFSVYENILVAHLRLFESKKVCAVNFISG